jgi:hypothetical protein
MQFETPCPLSLHTSPPISICFLGGVIHTADVIHFAQSVLACVEMNVCCVSAATALQHRTRNFFT